MHSIRLINLSRKKLASISSASRFFNEKITKNKTLLPSDAIISSQVEDCQKEYVRRDDILCQTSRLKDPSEIDILPSEKRLTKDKELMIDIRLSTELDQLMNIYLLKREVFLWSHFLGFLEQTTHFLKQGNCTATELQSNPYFQAFTYELWKKLPQYEVEYIVLILKNIIDLEIKSDSLIFQSVLQMIRHQINLLNIEEILELKSILKKISPCPLSSAIIKALPFILENLLKDPISSHFSTKQLSQMLYICVTNDIIGGHKIIKHLKEYQLPKILHHKEEHWEKELALIVSSLSRVPNRMWRKKNLDINTVLHHCKKELMESGLHLLSQKELLSMVKRLRDNYKRGRVLLLDEEFLVAVTKVAAANQESWDLNDILFLTHLLFDLNIIVEDLIDGAIEEFLKTENPPSLTVNRAMDFISILALSSNELSRLSALKIINTYLQICPEEVVSLPWAKYCINLSFLGINDDSLQTKLLSTTFLQKYRRIPPDTNSDLCLLSKIIAENPIKYSWLSDEVIRFLNSRRFLELPMDNSLNKPLRYLFNHTSFFISNVHVLDNIFIDYLILVDENGLALSLPRPNDANINLTNLTVPVNTKSVAVMKVPRTYSYGPNNKLDNRWSIIESILLKEGIDSIISLSERNLARKNSVEVTTFLHKRLSDLGLVL